MPTLLFEIGTEELPSWYVGQAETALPALMRQRLGAAGVSHGALRSFATPRRLAVLVADVGSHSAQREEVRRGPAASAAFDEGGAPTKAAIGFARASGVEPSALKVEETERGSYVFARRTVGGEPVGDLLPALLAGVVRDLPAPRKMRWGEHDVGFVRPLAWLVALLDDEVVPFQLAGLEAGRATRGHRFLHPHEVELRHALDYADAVAAADVVAERGARREAVVAAAHAAATAAGLELDRDPLLEAEVTDLVESPSAILGSFDAAFLDLPEAVLSTVMIHHQRFFPTRRADGGLAHAFVAISNNRVPDESVVRTGYEQVLRGRLEDARFFWDADRRETLAQHAWALAGIAFHKELGSMADKVARVAQATRRLAELLGVSKEEAATLKQALPLFRADLATQMVYELPELEGTMGRAFAQAEGLPESVAVALEDGVLPRGPGAGLPATRVGALLSVADRLDTVVGFFSIGRRPSGSADPFGVRRASLGALRTLSAQGWRVPLGKVVEAVAGSFGAPRADADVMAAVETYLWDRVAGLLADEDVPAMVVRAAVQGSRSVIGAARRAHLLQALVALPGFADLLTLHKRAANLAKQVDEAVNVRPGLFRDPVEAPLHDALPQARRGVERLMASARKQLAPWDLGRRPNATLTDLDAAVAEVVRLKAPLDAFFEGVLVMVDDVEVRANRLALLAEVAEALSDLGALSQLEAVAER